MTDEYASLSEATDKKPLVLILDDDPGVSETLKAVLEVRGYEVVTAAHGRTALNLLQERPPDVAILDILVPGIDGLTICRRMKSNPELMHIPVLIITVITKDSDLADGFWKMGSGADDFVTKPFDPFDLADRVERLHLLYSQARRALDKA